MPNARGQYCLAEEVGHDFTIRSHAPQACTTYFNPLQPFQPRARALSADFGMACNTPQKSATKRPRSSPTFLTPRRPRKRPPLRDSGLQGSVRHLSFQDETHVHAVRSVVSWSKEELKYLVEFILFHGTGQEWPTHKRTAFWEEAGSFVRRRARTSNIRSGIVLS